MSFASHFPPGVALRVLAIVKDNDTIRLMSRTIEQAATGDHFSVATDLAEGLARTVAESIDVVFVDVTLGKTAGLATVHHLSAVAAGVTVFAMATAESVELATQALTLGGAGLLVLPLSGDELLTCLSEVRTRRAERSELERLARDASRARVGASLLARVSEIAEARTRRDAAQRLADVLKSEIQAEQVIVYLSAAEGSRQLMRAAQRGEVGDSPAFAEEMDLLEYAQHQNLEVVRLVTRREHGGLALLGGIPGRERADEPLPLIDLVAAQAATALALIAERERSHRGAMKDPDSSAYTFAYFVDVAGREIDKARRHDRRFALVTMSVDDAASGADPSPDHPGVQLVDRVLTAVRDTDVLARVDEQEFYLLLPETGGIGAHVCRRRIMRQLGTFAAPGAAGDDPIEVSIGVATFPNDGLDLSQLLRVAKHRSDVSCRSVVRRLCEERVPLAEMLDLVTWQLAEADADEHAAETLRTLELSPVEVASLAGTLLREALRGGSVRVVATRRQGVGPGAAAQSVLARESPHVHADVVDVSSVHGCSDLEIFTVIAEHGAYALLGRTTGSVTQLVHTADPLFADLLIQRLSEATGMRFAD